LGKYGQCRIQVEVEVADDHLNDENARPLLTLTGTKAAPTRPDSLGDSPYLTSVPKPWLPANNCNDIGFEDREASGLNLICYADTFVQSSRMTNVMMRFFILG